MRDLPTTTGTHLEQLPDRTKYQDQTVQLECDLSATLRKRNVENDKGRWAHSGYFPTQELKEDPEDILALESAKWNCKGKNGNGAD